MVADAGTLTTLQNNFISVFSGGRIVVFHYALSLIGILAPFSISLSALFLILGEGNDPLKPFIKQVMTIGLFIFCIYGFGPGYKGLNLMDSVLRGFTMVGSTAGGGGAQADIMSNPSAIIMLGFQATKPIFSAFTLDPLTLILQGLAGILILLSYFVLAIQIFVCTIEFGIVSTLGACPSNIFFI